MIRLELRSTLYATLNHNSLGRAMRKAAGEELGRLGVPGTPSVTIKPGGGSRAIRVRFNGALAGYPPDLLTRVWQGVAPRPLQATALDAVGHGGFPDRWVDEMPDPPAVENLVVALTIALMRRRPDLVLGDRALEAYVAELQALLPETTSRVIPWGAILRPLIRLTGSLADRKAVGSSVFGAIAMGLTDPDDVVESAFAELRDDGVTVMWSSALGDWRADAGEELIGRLFGSLGLPFPELRLAEGVGADPVRLDVVTVGLPGVAAAMIGRDEMLVESREPDGVDGSTVMHPVTGARAMVVRADVRDQLEKAGSFVVDAKRLAIQILARELEEHRRRLVSISEVEHQLELLRAAAPAVVAAAVATFPLAELTRIARLLVEDGISLGDLKGSLDRLLDFEASSPPVPGAPPAVEGNGGGSRRPTARDYADAVRAGRGYGLPASELAVIEVDPGLAAQLEARRVPELLAAAICDATWAVLPDGEQPVVVTGPAARRALRAVLADELPALEVVADAELPPELERRVVGTIVV